MVYIYKGNDNSCSVFYQIKHLSIEDQRKVFRVLAELPPYEEKEGYVGMLKYDPNDDSFYWKDVEIEINDNEEDH